MDGQVGLMDGVRLELELCLPVVVVVAVAVAVASSVLLAKSQQPLAAGIWKLQGAPKPRR